MSGIQSSAAAEACFIPAEITANSSMNTGENLDLGLSLSGSELVLSPDKLSIKVNEIVQQLLSDRGFLPNLEIANESQLGLQPASPSSSPRLFAAAEADQSRSKLPACTHTHSHFFSEARNEAGDSNLRTLDLETDTIETEQEVATGGTGGTSEEPDSIDIGDDEESGNIFYDHLV